MVGLMNALHVQVLEQTMIAVVMNDFFLVGCPGGSGVACVALVASYTAGAVGIGVWLAHGLQQVEMLLQCCHLFCASILLPCFELLIVACVGKLCLTCIVAMLGRCPTHTATFSDVISIVQCTAAFKEVVDCSTRLCDILA